MVKIKKIQQALKSISNIAKILSDRGWAEANAGNISFNVSDVIGDEFETSIIITSSGSRMREIAVAPEKFCGVLTFLSGEKGYRISKFGEDEFIPTSEYLSHINIHRYLVNSGRPEKAIIHSHPDELIAAMHSEELDTEKKINTVFKTMHSEFNMLIPNGVGYLKFIESGSSELAEKTLKELEGNNIVLWKDHGCISIGDSLDLALDNIEIVNKVSKLFLLQK